MIRLARGRSTDRRIAITAAMLAPRSRSGGGGGGKTAVLPGEKIESLIRSAPTLQGKARRLLEGIYWAKNLPFLHERDRLNITLYLLTCFVHSSRCNHAIEVADNITGTADWLAHIVADLEDLNRGRVPPRFAPKRRRSGRPARVMLAPRYAAAARAAEAVMANAPTLQGKARKLVEGIYGAKNLLPPGVVEHERDRLILTLYLLRHFAYSSDAIETADWLAHIVAGLEDLNRGRGASMFARTAPKGRNPPKSSEIWRGRALIANGGDLFIDSGMTREDIKKKLRAGKFGDLRVFVDDRHHRAAETLSEVLSDRKVLSNRAIGWREQLMKDEVQNNPQAVTIWNGRHHKLAADGHNREEVAYKFFQLALAEACKVKPVEAERPTPRASPRLPLQALARFARRRPASAADRESLSLHGRRRQRDCHAAAVQSRHCFGHRDALASPDVAKAVGR
jgi:hypothetical protein